MAVYHTQEDIEGFFKAVGMGNITDVCIYLANVDVNVRNKSGWTALHKAASNKNQELCRILLENGAWVNVVDSNDATPLQYVLSSINSVPQYGDMDGTINVLVEFGADIRHVGKYGDTILHDLARHGSSGHKYIEYFVAHGADLTIRNSQGMTPKNEAKRKHDIKTMHFFESLEDKYLTSRTV